MRARLEKLIAASTEPSTADTDLRAHVELTLQAQEGRAEGARRLNYFRKEQSDLVRGQIRAVVQALPLSHPLDGLVSSIRKRLALKGQSAGDWQIEDEIRELRKEAKAASDTEPKPTLSGHTLAGIR